MTAMLISAIVFASSGSVHAAESEFPAEWFFGSMEKMRASLEGGPAVELATDTWIGDSTTLADCQGKVVVLDFWATWCGPCIASIPKNIALVDDFKDDLVFIGMHSSTSGWDEAADMVADRKINYPVVLDTGETAAAYGVTGFPTYVVIDRAGIVRAAGVQPSHVKEIVMQLIEESGSAGQSNQIAGFDRDWFYGGSARMKSWQDQLGQAAHPIRAKAWWTPDDAEGTSSEVDKSELDESAESIAATDEVNADQPVDAASNAIAADEPETLATAPIGLEEADLDGAVRVLHFTRPGMSLTEKYLKQLNGMAAKYVSQGVVFTVVCDSESDWTETQNFATKNDLIVPMALDAAATKKPDMEVREAGRTAQSYHVRVAPVTVVVDREGSIRATGLKLEQLNKALELLLSEQAR